MGKLPEPTVDLSKTVKLELPKFIDRLNIFRKAEHKKMGFEDFYKPCRIGGGRKYIKIVHDSENGGRYVEATYCFVRLADGAILKADAGRPALNLIRGYIFSRDVSQSCTWFGAKYNYEL